MGAPLHPLDFIDRLKPKPLYHLKFNIFFKTIFLLSELKCAPPPSFDLLFGGKVYFGSSSTLCKTEQMSSNMDSVPNFYRDTGEERKVGETLKIYV